ncbi:hypothetical protein A9Q99_20560 [Gammaproteobacteria bacterium 45_16_T64]|nr:hypothetical protein A9Q99_20560 [Gammaproteobacteria bacterium 45_16_T64]
MISTTKKKVAFFTLLCALFTSAIHAEPLDKTRFRIDSLDGNGEQFLAGVYMYRAAGDKGTPEDGAGWDELSLDAHFRWLSQLGINLIHTDDIRMKDRLDTTTFLQLAEKHNLKVIWQIGNAIVDKTDAGPTLVDWCSERCEFGADYASGAIKNYQDTNTSILAYSVDEEPQHAPTGGDMCLTQYEIPLSGGLEGIRVDEMCFLMNYYEKIIYNVVQRGGSEEIPLYLLHNETASAQFMKDNYTGYESNVPLLTGSDRYFMARDANYLHNPNKALNLFNNQTPNDSSNKGISVFRKNKLEPQAFMSVISGNAQVMYNDNDELDVETVGLIYYAPKYAMRAQVWLGIANASHGVMAWSADVLDQKPLKDSRIYNMAGLNNRGHRTLFEYSETIRELQKFGWIINRLEDYEADATILDEPDSMIVSHAVDIDGVSGGKLYVVVNKRISINTNATSDGLGLEINDVGELSEESFPPIEVGLDIHISSVGSGIYDIATGTQYLAGDVLNVEPGGGVMLFKGTKEALDSIRHLSGITSTHKISGSLSSDLENGYQNKRIVFPSAPLTGNGSYVIDGLFSEREFELDRQYQLHMSVSGDGGASFQARVFGYKDGIQVTASDIGLVETALTSEVTTMVSDVFSVLSSEADTARVYFYHQNKQGELSVHDAWLEDVSDQTRFSSYYKINYGLSLSPNKRYKVHVEARELEGEDSTIAVRYLAFNDQHQVIEASDVNGVTWGAELTKEFQFVTTEDSIFNVERSDVSYIRIAIYRPNKSVSPDNEIVLRNVWVEEVLD